MPGNNADVHRGVVLLATTRVAYGVALLASPSRCARALGGAAEGTGPVDGATRAVARVLGGRHVLQGAAELVFGERTLVPGAAVDALHAASMVLLARVDEARSRPARHDAAIESGFVVAGILLAVAAAAAAARNRPAGR